MFSIASCVCRIVACDFFSFLILPVSLTREFGFSCSRRSLRSPWSNKYDPPIDDGLKPSDELRKMEVEANKIFALYVDQYYGHAASTSVYFWDLDGAGFASCWLVEKRGDTNSKFKNAVWDAIHVLQVMPNKSGAHDYQLTSTVMVDLGIDNKDVGNLSLSGSLIRQSKKSSNDGNLISQMGMMIEKQESGMKSEIEKIYFGKMSYVMSNLRHTENAADTKLAGLAQMAEKTKDDDEKAT